jgi:hypothetical protein
VAIKGGDLIHIANHILVDRAQTAGPGQINIPSEKIYELGNYESLATVYDTPDLTWTVESLDASAEFEAMLVNAEFSVANGEQTVTVIGNPTGGDFTLDFGGQVTSVLNHNAASATVQTALRALSNVPTGEITVVGAAGGPYTVTLSGSLAENTPAGVTVLTADGSALTGGSNPGVTVTAGDLVTMADGTALNLAQASAIDVASVFKPGQNAPAPFNVIGSVGIPNLTLESVSYRFAVGENASQTATLRGDSVFYNPSSTFIEYTAGTNADDQVVPLAYPAIVYNGDTVNGPRYALSVALASTGKRLAFGADYTENVTGTGNSRTVTITVRAAVPTTDQIRVMYASDQPSVYPQLSHAAVTAVRPAAIRGRNVEVFLGGTALTDRWTSVQNVTIDWRVTLEKDEELGNAQAVSQDFDIPEVSGSLELKPRDYTELYEKIRQIANVGAGEVIGPLTTVKLPLLIVLHSPEIPAPGQPAPILKSIYIPDARFTLPGFSGQAGVGQKMTVTFNWESDTGKMLIYKGEMP